jgi:DNA-binding NarL/FixJ family response regulator
VTVWGGVADDQQLMRIALCGILGSAGDVTVVGAAGTGVQAVELSRRAAATAPTRSSVRSR